MVESSASELDFSVVVGMETSAFRYSPRFSDHSVNDICKRKLKLGIENYTELLTISRLKGNLCVIQYQY